MKLKTMHFSLVCALVYCAVFWIAACNTESSGGDDTGSEDNPGDTNTDDSSVDSDSNPERSSDSHLDDSEKGSDATQGTLPRPDTAATQCQMSDVDPIRFEGTCPAGHVPCNGECLTEVGATAGNCEVLAMELYSPHGIALHGDSVYHFSVGGFLLQTDLSSLTTTCVMKFDGPVSDPVIRDDTLYFSWSASIFSDVEYEYDYGLIALGLSSNAPVFLTEDNYGSIENLTFYEDRLLFGGGTIGSLGVADIPVTGGTPNLHQMEGWDSVDQFFVIGDQLYINTGGDIGIADIPNVISATLDENLFEISLVPANGWISNMFVVDGTVYWEGYNDTVEGGIFKLDMQSHEVSSVIESDNALWFLAAGSDAVFYTTPHPDDETLHVVNRLTLPGGTPASIGTVEKNSIVSAFATDTHLYLTVGDDWPGALIRLSL